MNKIQYLLCTASVLTIAAGTASAAGFEVVDPVVEPTSPVIGSAGLTFGKSDLTDDDGDDEGDGRYSTFDANIGYMFSGGHLISVDLGLRDDSGIDHGSTGSSAFSEQKHIALQYMYNMPSGFGIGAFAGVSRAPHNPSNEDYKGSFGVSSYGLDGKSLIWYK